MSDDLVKRYSSYNIMMLGDSGNEVSTPDGEWVKYKDYKAQSARIEELEGKLARVVEALFEAIYLLDPDEEDMPKKAGVYRIVTTFKELKGETGE